MKRKRETMQNATRVCEICIHSQATVAITFPVCLPTLDSESITSPYTKPNTHKHVHVIYKPLFMTNSAELVYDTLLAEWYSGHSGVLYLIHIRLPI